MKSHPLLAQRPPLTCQPNQIRARATRLPGGDGLFQLATLQEEDIVRRAEQAAPRQPLTQLAGEAPQ
jgi:hypothetical protein